jgi:hypothetical protein
MLEFHCSIIRKEQQLLYILREIGSVDQTPVLFDMRENYHSSRKGIICCDHKNMRCRNLQRKAQICNHCNGKTFYGVK